MWKWHEEKGPGVLTDLTLGSFQSCHTSCDVGGMT